MNLVADEVRAHLDPLDRVEEGRVCVERMRSGLSFDRIQSAYSGTDEERFPGLDAFLEDRSDRDIVFGVGPNDLGYSWVTPIRITG